MISDPCVPQSLKIRTKTQLSLNYRDCGPEKKCVSQIGDWKRKLLSNIGTGTEHVSQK